MYGTVATFDVLAGVPRSCPPVCRQFVVCIIDGGGLLLHCAEAVYLVAALLAVTAV